MPNALHRFISALFAAIALGVAAHEWHGPMFFAALTSSAFALLWITEARWQCAGAGGVLRPVAYALGLAALGLPLVQPEILLPGKNAVSRADWSSAIAFAPALALAGWSLARQAAATVRAAAAASCVGLITLAAYAPGISAALLVTALAFAAGARTLVGTAILAAVAYIGVFYYSLHATLLAKSIALAAAGCGCLIAMLVVRRLHGSARS